MSRRAASPIDSGIGEIQRLAESGVDARQRLDQGRGERAQGDVESFPGEAIYRAALPSWKQAQKRSLDILGNEGEKGLSNMTRRIRTRPSRERG